MSAESDFLRHAAATLAYRAAKALRDVPAEFADARACPTCRTAGEIVAHLGDLAEWALLTARGEEDWRIKQPRPWDASVARFFEGLRHLDDCLIERPPSVELARRLLQGPLADALTHVGQLATLRRIAGSPVRGEDYSRAAISAGRVGWDQAAPAIEFD